jgi:hypothetical protein
MYQNTPPAPTLVRCRHPRTIPFPNVAGVVRCEKNYSVAISSGRTEPAERNSIRDRFLALFAHFRGSQQITQPGRVYGARTYSVHANAAIL